MSDLVEKVAAEIDWEAFSPHISCGSRTKEFQDAARKKAKAAIATVFRAMMEYQVKWHYEEPINFFDAFAAEHSIALAPSGEGEGK